MKDDPVTEATLRQFLLGQVEDEERQRIETLFLIDPKYKDRILGVEQDLVEDYLEDSLTTVDREKFLAHYAATPEQRRKLRIMQSVKDWAHKNSNVLRENPPAISIWSRLRAGLKLKPVFVIPAAVTAMVAIVVAALWLNQERQERNRAHLARQEELAQLNDPGKVREGLSLVSLELSPISVRSAEREAELNRRSDLQVVELRLLWIRQETHPTYRAVIQRLGDDEMFSVNGLHAEGDGGKLIRLRVPVSLLTRGLYQIQVSGSDETSASGPAEEYRFTVGS